MAGAVRARNPGPQLNPTSEGVRQEDALQMVRFRGLIGGLTNLAHRTAGQIAGTMNMAAVVPVDKVNSILGTKRPRRRIH